MVESVLCDPVASRRVFLASASSPISRSPGVAFRVTSLHVFTSPHDVASSRCVTSPYVSTSKLHVFTHSVPSIFSRGCLLAHFPRARGLGLFPLRTVAPPPPPPPPPPRALTRHPLGFQQTRRPPHPGPLHSRGSLISSAENSLISTTSAFAQW